MVDLVIDEEKERALIIKEYRQLVKMVKPRMKSGDDKRLRRAFEVAVDAHKEQRRKSGEPYILHPIAVAKIVASEIGLGTTSVMCALLHDTVEDTEITLDDIKREFGEEVCKIIDGLTKIGKISSQTESIQAENYRKILLTLSDDIRVILIKIADRLHNMRTLETVSRKNQLKISSETIYLYAPLAHRLGLYSIKSEFEDLSMKYTESDKYKEIAKQLHETKKERNRFINDFIKPIQEDLLKAGLNAEVVGRPKSIFSIWNKIKKKGVTFDDVYDKFAIRIIIDSEPEKEKEECWRAYSIVTDQYQPSPNRLRDWLSHPKANGYESLHTTVMGSKGKWVEVQIRSKRMDEIAEKGLAAHYRYKENKGKNQNTAEDAIESWLMQVREYLKNSEANPLEFMDDFKLQLYTKEIYVFSPKGELKVLPVGATALDFAYMIHSAVGDTCIGAKVNNKLEPISYVLQSGDQVEIITSKKQKPSEAWLNIATTSRAQAKIKNSLREEKKTIAEVGKEILERKLKSLKVVMNNENMQVLVNFYKMPSIMDLNYGIAQHQIDLTKLKNLNIVGNSIEIPKVERKVVEEEYTPTKNKIDKNAELIIFGESSNQFPYEFAKCCNPISGDDVVGFISINGVIKIHRTSCKNVINLMSKYGYRIVKTVWTKSKSSSFLTGIFINGIDDLGVINKITRIISEDLKVNMQSMSIESNNGIFEGKFKVFMKNQEELDLLLNKLKGLSGIQSVSRIEDGIL
ncbi:MAG: bifunctional (p)ppGpp synthetase/guanosine-3',5'-bis(diphosphate) 3'-pyrophosphohydrolase [Chitinophagales bacterium]|nr:bifunctional (p)ppGpp synthetase/guanosine-3',5'-bis(diphosphate) 3'-pyrophosphohydrolase [Chitinophagales bacterium]